MLFVVEDSFGRSWYGASAVSSWSFLVPDFWCFPMDILGTELLAFTMDFLVPNFWILDLFLWMVQ
jgi:hypothetical protein